MPQEFGRAAGPDHALLRSRVRSGGAAGISRGSVVVSSYQPMGDCVSIGGGYHPIFAAAAAAILAAVWA